MVFLAAVGPAVEGAADSIRMAAVYIVGGVLGTLAHWVMTTSAQPIAAGYPIIGASSSIAALVGYYWLRFHRRTVPILPKVRVPVYAIVIVWLALQIGGGILANHSFYGPVAYWAHVGGFLAGFALGLIFRAEKEAREEAWRDRFDEATLLGPNTRIAAAREYLKEHPNDAQALFNLCEGLEATGEREQLIEELKKLFYADPLFGGAYAAVRLSELAPDSLDSGARVRAAQAIAPKDKQASEKILQGVLAMGTEQDQADALNLLIELRGGGEDARVFATMLVDHFELSPQLEIAKRKWPALFSQR
jgi:hypothetical protein